MVHYPSLPPVNYAWNLSNAFYMMALYILLKEPGYISAEYQKTMEASLADLGICFSGIFWGQG